MTNPLSNLRSEIAQINLISVLQQRSAANASTAAAHANWMRAEPRDFPSTASGQDAMMVGAVSTLVSELVDSIDRADPSQAGHASRVAALSTMLGSSIGMGVKELRALRVSALLHDVGKILVPTEILSKNGPLTSSETAEMRRHVVYGGAILSRIQSWRSRRPPPAGTMSAGTALATRTVWLAMQFRCSRALWRLLTHSTP